MRAHVDEWQTERARRVQERRDNQASQVEPSEEEDSQPSNSVRQDSTPLTYRRRGKRPSKDSHTMEQQTNTNVSSSSSSTIGSIQPLTWLSLHPEIHEEYTQETGTEKPVKPQTPHTTKKQKLAGNYGPHFENISRKHTANSYKDFDGTKLNFSRKNREKYQRRMQVEAVISEKTGIRSWSLPDIQWGNGNSLAREFFPDIDSTQPEPTEKLISQWTKKKYNESNLNVLEEGRDYRGYDKHCNIIAAYFYDAHSRAHKDMGTHVVNMANWNIKELSYWQTKLLAADMLKRHQMTSMVYIIH